MPNSRASRRLAWIGVPIALAALVAAFWNWDWFIPLVQSRASATIGRPVTISHLHMHLGRVVIVTADGVVVANPHGWPSSDPPLAAVRMLTVAVDAWEYIQGNGLIVPLIKLDGPKVYVAETRDGEANFHISTGSSGSESVKIGDLRIDDGVAHVLIPALKADFNAKINTQGEGDTAKIVVDAQGTYAAQPITAEMTGGALLSLRDADHPWPVKLTMANGQTHVALDGTLRDPVRLKGADVQVRLAGPDMGLLKPLSGIPIPETPPYQIAGKLDLDGLDKIRITDFQGRLGNSDLTGIMEILPIGIESKGGSKPVVSMDVRSNRVDLADLNGLTGGAPGRTNTPNATPQQREAVAKASASPKLLPDTPINVPRLNWADIHLRYHAAHIEGRNIPLDDVNVTADLVNGRLAVHPASFGVGKGQLTSNVDLVPTSDKDVHVRLDLHMRNLDVSRIMASTHTFGGAGSISGVGAIDATGNSLASLIANGKGEVKMAMAGGNLSAVLVDLTGLQFGNALLSALGLPNQTQVRCFVGNFGMQRGMMDFKALTLDTDEAITNVGGHIDLTKETIDLALKTDAKHFSIGSLPTRIHIGGTLKNPAIRPGAEVAARAGATAGLAALFVPLAILPTIQLGTSEADDMRCGQLLEQARASAGGKALPPLQQGASSRQ